MGSAWRVFWQQFRENFHTTGAIAPSSRALARELCWALKDQRAVADSPPRRILEVGPGTGAVTRFILGHLRPGDRLDLVEINPQFVQFLQRALESDPRFRIPPEVEVQLHQGSVLRWEPQEPYEVLISGLPLNNFQPQEVQEFLDRFAWLTRAGGVVSFFQYIGVRRLRQWVASAATRSRLRGIGQVLHATLSQYEVRRRMVLGNLPPAWVHHLRFADPRPPSLPGKIERASHP